jgi:hypothetical protein
MTDSLSEASASAAVRAAPENFMTAKLEDPVYGEYDGGFGATVSLNQKKRGRKKYSN